jgi:2-haloacid dehalogenase
MERNSGERPSREVLLATEKKPFGQPDAKGIRKKRATESFSFDRYTAITFDCYGTLIDWERGLLGALRPILRCHGQNLSDAQILAVYAELEPAAQNPYRRYRDVLAKVAHGFAERLGFALAPAEAESLAESIEEWQPFPDTVAALERLKTRFKLGIISNVDDDLFAASARHLKVKFDHVITAEQAKAYKPSLAPFHLALERFGTSAERVVHAGQSVYHDVLPAKSLGLATVLVYRRGFGAARPAAGVPDLQVPDLETLAERAFEATASR